MLGDYASQKKMFWEMSIYSWDGEFMVLVGPSGSGKTTMIKIINRLLGPTDGNIYMDEANPKTWWAWTTSFYWNLCFTGHLLCFPNLTVAKVLLVPEMKGWTKEEIAQKTEGF